MAGEYATAEQLAALIGGIKPGTIRSLRQRGMPAAKVGKAWIYPIERALAWIREQEQSECRVQTLAPVSNKFAGGNTSMLSGMKAGGNAAEALALQTAERLKRSSRPSCANANSPTVLPARLG